MQITEELIRQLVIEVVDKIEGLKNGQTSLKPEPKVEDLFSNKVLSGYDVECFFKQKKTLLHLKKSTIITPLAKERARDLGITLIIN